MFCRWRSSLPFGHRCIISWEFFQQEFGIWKHYFCGQIYTFWEILPCWVMSTWSETFGEPESSWNMGWSWAVCCMLFSFNFLFWICYKIDLCFLRGTFGLCIILDKLAQFCWHLLVSLFSCFHCVITLAVQLSYTRIPNMYYNSIKIFLINSCIEGDMYMYFRFMSVLLT